MFGIEEISLGYIPNSGQKLLQLIQYLPSLQRISFLGTWIDQSTQQRDIITLSSSLRFFCPELRSIHTTAAYNFASNEYDTLDDSELASLIQSTKALEHFKVEVASLGRLMSDSLITQYESLVALLPPSARDSLVEPDLCASCDYETGQAIYPFIVVIV
ncbi:hypothetical protein BGZ59_007260 [Podila verticillata]|nr:hypothetical protein BGZ59_007260 [Podila verticillata]